MAHLAAKMKIGYARTSTGQQKAGLEAQLRDLKAAGAGKIFSEQLSSVDAKRAQLEAAIEFCREGDELLCTKLDRLARSVADLVKLEERLKAKGASICIMDPAMDTGTPNGRLMFNVIAAIAQFEREVSFTPSAKASPKPKAKANTKAGRRQPGRNTARCSACFKAASAQPTSQSSSVSGGARFTAWSEAAKV